MSSVDRSKNKRGLHKSPSRRTAANAGQPRAAINAGEAGGVRLGDRSGHAMRASDAVGRDLRLTGMASSNATRQRGKESSFWKLRESGVPGEPETRARTTMRTNPGQSRDARFWTGKRNASEPSRPPLSRRSSGEQWARRIKSPLEVDDVDSYRADRIRNTAKPHRRDPQSMGGMGRGQDPERRKEEPGSRFRGSSRMIRMCCDLCDWGRFRCHCYC